MKIVAFLQNLWVKDPARVGRLFAAAPHKREDYLHWLLFAGGKTGRILKANLGDKLVKQIIWEESTTQIGGDAKSVFPPEPEHIQRVLEKHRPDMVIAFGRVAATAVFAASRELMIEKAAVQFHFRSLPHPCARADQDPLGAIRHLRDEILSYQGMEVFG